jgi:hypothetical protein
VRRVGKTPASADGRSFVAEEVAAERPPPPTARGPSPRSTPSLLQGVGSSDQKQRAVYHGDELLKLLDEVRDGLLAGGISRQTLTKLAVATSKRRESFADPRLQTVLDEIELRAKVELAKLEQAGRASW